MLVPIFTYIYLNILFLFLNEIDVCNFAYDTTPFVCHKNLTELLEKLERNSELLIYWFGDDMKLNTDKCHVLISDHKFEHQWAEIVKVMASEENEVELLGITIDNELKFDSPISNICLKANEKSSVL